VKIVKLSVITLLLIGSAEAKNARDKTWEFFFTPEFVQSKTLDFDGGAEAEINTRTGLGFGFGYNLNPNVEFTLLFSASSGNYKGTRVDENGEHKEFTSNTYTNSLNLGATYNFLDGAFTPYVTGTLGVTYVDSGITVEDGHEYCWWDPWWGYMCRSVTYTDTKMNYGASIGLRYDFSSGLFIKGGVGKNYIDFDSTNSPDFLIYDFTIGGTF
jgi:opacity protein-like surface antigen